MRTLIIGGVAGGASAAARLRRLDECAEIIIFERGDYISYANCGLPYFIGGDITHKSALTLQTPESFKKRFNIDVRVKHEVLSVDATAKKVLVKDISGGIEYYENYDNLILSPGAKPVLPAISGIDNEKVFTLRNIPDTYKIQEYIIKNKPKSAAVIGGGYIGVEMTENLCKAGLKVTIVEISDHLIGPLDFDMAADIHRYLRSNNVELILGNGVKQFHHSEDRLTVELNCGSFDCDIAIIAVGVTPDTGFLVSSGLKMTKRGAISVDEYMHTSAPFVYAVGDAVETVNYITHQRAFIPLAGPANKQGRIAADNICGLKSTYKGTQGSSILKLFDMTVAVTGLNEQSANTTGYDYDKVYLLASSHASYYPGASNMTVKVLFENETGKILGAQIIGFNGVDKRIDVLATAIRAGMTAFDLAELDLAYAPPFSSAKDPVNMTGFMMENILTGKVKQFHHNEIPSLLNRENIMILDVRTESEYKRGHIPFSTNIPLDSLRCRISDIPSDKTIYVNCQSGLRSYIACRLLTQNGFDCYNLAGGYRLYASVNEETQNSKR